MRSLALWFVGVVALLGSTVGIGLGFIEFDMALLVLVLVALVAAVAFRMPTVADRDWLTQFVLLGFAAKLSGSALRWATLVFEYGGSGDAAAYHGRGQAINDIWRSFQVPDIQIQSAGTTFVTKVTGLFYAPYEPSMLGGFFMFATVAFFGQLLCYAAYRRARPNYRIKTYGLLILFLPSMVFWPSSIGKESLMIFFIGLFAYGLAGLYTDYRIRWLVPLGLGILLAAQVRIHMAALMAGAAAIGVAAGRAHERGASVQFRRFLIAGLAAVTVMTVFVQTGAEFGIDPQDIDVDPFISELERRTQQGGSATEGSAIRTLADAPAGAVRVLFRPLPWEAHNLQALMASLESAALIGIILWRLPGMIRRLPTLRRKPYLLASLAYSTGFVIAFSAIFNLGILARQRTQMLPFLLAVVVGLGWPEQTEDPAEQTAPSQLITTTGEAT